MIWTPTWSPIALRVTARLAQLATADTTLIARHATMMIQIANYVLMQSARSVQVMKMIAVISVDLPTRIITLLQVAVIAYKIMDVTILAKAVFPAT